MTTVNLIATFGTSITFDLGEDFDPEEDEIPWEDVEEAARRYLDSLSEQQLRQLYSEADTITLEDPVFDEFSDVDVEVYPCQHEAIKAVELGSWTEDHYYDEYECVDCGETFFEVFTSEGFQTPEGEPADLPEGIEIL